ncbi:MAG: hypothetical protein CMJ78_24460, partial [Planctomycetaceae bacterium]|nr:hypothetical protein [Planctomycetaceae bacterium]
GRDLIIHLVRIPPTRQVDYEWADEPRPLKGTAVTIDTAGAKLQSVHSCRPYHFEEPQQVVQSEIQATQADGKTTIEIPPFRYHTMLVIRLEKNNKALPPRDDDATE